MRHKLLAVLAVVILTMVLSVSAATGVGAQDVPSSAVPAPHIVPKPNTGHEPTEAGDRGGALQLLLPAVLLVVFSGAVLHLRAQSRRARSQ